jgi:D-tyrosyl-tRNA(Tyr) deacylase
MRAVVQRVSDCSVSVDGTITGSISTGLLVYLGVHRQDTMTEVRFLANKIVNLRIFPDTEGKMNRSLIDIGGGILVISQFTLYADTARGRRPSYSHAAPPETAIPLYEAFLSTLADLGIPPERGVFGASMKVRYCNEGPVTIIIDSVDR